jgi:autoinducer 2-degrading protein
MLIRIVRMSFKSDKVSDFKLLFEEVEPKIQNFPGCLHVELCNDPEDENVFSTFSKWEDEEALEDYRSSVLFAQTWKRTKVFFDKKAQAYSLISND